MNVKLIAQHIDSSPRAPWLRRLGLAGFSFFFIKGMLWLLIPLLAHLLLSGQG